MDTFLNQQIVQKKQNFIHKKYPLTKIASLWIYKSNMVNIPRDLQDIIWKFMGYDKMVIQKRIDICSCGDFYCRMHRFVTLRHRSIQLTALVNLWAEMNWR